MVEKTMPGASNEPVRENPTVRSKFDKSQGRGLPAPHLTFPGQVAPVTNDGAARVRMEPKDVTSRGSYRSEHISPSNLGTAMAEGRRMANAPNMGQTAYVGKSTTLGLSGMLKGPSGTPSGGDGVRHDKQHDTRSAGRLGSNVQARNKSGASDNVVSRRSSKQGPGALHANKRGSGPNLK